MTKPLTPEEAREINRRRNPGGDLWWRSCWTGTTTLMGGVLILREQTIDLPPDGPKWHPDDAELAEAVRAIAERTRSGLPLDPFADMILAYAADRVDGRVRIPPGPNPRPTIEGLHAQYQEEMRRARILERVERRRASYRLLAMHQPRTTALVRHPQKRSVTLRPALRVRKKDGLWRVPSPLEWAETQVGRRYGIAPTTLRDWRKLYGWRMDDRYTQPLRLSEKEG